jgi:D-3-phosphoglycerate dehydrogenase
VFSDGKPRFIQIKGINIDAEIGQHMLYTTNTDVPGIIGFWAQTMGENGVNIANFTLGRVGAGRGGDRAALSRRTLAFFISAFCPLRNGVVQHPM